MIIVQVVISNDTQEPHYTVPKHTTTLPIHACPLTNTYSPLVASMHENTQPADSMPVFKITKTTYAVVFVKLADTECSEHSY